MKGKKSLVLKTLERELQKTAKNLQFEKSQYVKKQIEALEYTTKPKSTFGYLDENVEKTRSQELSALVKVVNLDKSPARIECYDVSNLFGREATGSMVVFSKGYADKDQYRRFKIKSVRGINDTAMISEVLDRRFKNDWEKPDLIIIDGGKAQFNAAVAIVKEYGLRIPVISLAKRMEEIYTLDKPMPIRLPSNNDALKLVQRIRDEAHRFAISYHRKLRHKQFLSSEQK
ncbi:hypothetical protein IH981_03810 [Patescibacteria group bacterium]|nr:hypothetical protein [Patescibacteria group bacterium]